LLNKVKTISESQEAKLHDEVILMWNRNVGKRYIVKRIIKRMFKCLNGSLRAMEINDEK